MVAAASAHAEVFQYTFLWDTRSWNQYRVDPLFDFVNNTPLLFIKL